MWFDVEAHGKASELQISYFHKSILDHGCFRFATVEGSTIVYARNGTLQVETFNNIYKADDRCSEPELEAYCESPLGFEKAKLTKQSDSLLIYETGVTHLIEPERLLETSLCILFLDSKHLHCLYFTVLSSSAESQESMIGIVLGLGPKWWAEA